MAHGFAVTSADLATLPDVPGLCYEIIDGELLVSRQPTIGHQRISTRTVRYLDAWSEESGLGVAMATPGLVFADDQDVVPDVVWISTARLAVAEDAQGHLRLAPELVVEVLSPGRANELRDRELKLALYARREVEEYWILDGQRHLVDVYRRGTDGLLLVATLGDDDQLTSPLLPGFVVPVRSLWPTHP